MTKRELTDAGAREIARRMVQAVREPPDPDNASVLEGPKGGWSAADEARIDRALVELGFVPPDATEDAESDAAGERAP